jgi:hypothetical protein
MRWLKHTISIVLLLVAVGVVLATVFSDHSDDYGQVSLPQGGTLRLPEGKVTVFYRELADPSQPDQGAGGFAFHVVPAQGGPPIDMSLAGEGTTELSTTRSETIGEHGALAKLDVPVAGDYVVSGSTNLPAGTSFLEFGTNAASALTHRWKLIAGLLLGAMLVALIPVPRRSSRRWEGDSGGWSSDPRAPYAG